MKRVTSILIGILLGALAAGLGVGIFFKKANDDRRILGEQLEALSRTALDIRMQSQAAVDSANTKVQAANSEVIKVQTLVQGFEQDAEAMTKATMLFSPPSQMIVGWKEVVGFELGMSVKIPPGSFEAVNDSKHLQLQTIDASAGPWFSLEPYGTAREQALLSSVTGTLPVTYTLRGRLLQGVQGTDVATQLPALLLRIRFKGRNVALLYAHEPSRSAPRPSLMMKVLSTLQFSSN